MPTAAQKKLLAQSQALLAKLKKEQAARDAAAAKQKTADAAAKAEAEAAAAEARQAVEDAKVAAAKAKEEYDAAVEADPSILAKKGGKIFQMLGNKLYFDGAPFSGVDEGIRYINGVSYGKAIPEAIEEPTLAIDTFKNTLALAFGQQEMSQPWVNGLYKSVSKFVKSGSEVDEAFNLALQDSRNDPNMKPFTDRFKAIYAIQDLKASGKAIEVPTIAEYFKTESAAGDVLRNTGLGSLATGSFLSDVFSKGVDLTEFSDRITAVFDRIDQAPDTIQKVMKEKYSYIDRPTLAKALLTGETGAKALLEQVKGYEVLAAANNQKIREQRMVDGKLEGVLGGITEAQAANYAAAGQTFATATTGFAQVAQARETEQKLAEISGQKSMGVAGLSEAILGKNAEKLSDIERLSLQEENRYRGKSGVGTLASSKRAQSF